MIDCVSREAVLELIEKWQLMWDTAYSCVENLPSVTPERPKWIPVSERLPESEEYVLVTAKDCLGCSYIDVAYHGKNGWHDITDTVVAWMPLPKTYIAEN